MKGGADGYEGNRAAATARLFDELVDRPADEREPLLAAVEPALRQDVEELLRAHEAAGSFLVDPAPRPDPGGAAGEPGERVGAWRLLEVIGHGGMGTVWLAERADGSYDQRAALKRIRGGFVSAAAADRFLLERRMLARLSHPNIARLLDGGLDDHGAPYLVLEHVRGAPIDLYADQRRLPFEARLALFFQVCDAVRHAHAQLVVHRDLKPSNILVDDEGRVKLLDFGIAKLLLDESDGGPTPTVGGLPPFTPEYAAPEQLTGAAATTATDVFALAVVLWELIAGARPRALTLPGTSPTDAPAVSAAVAEARATTPRELRRRLAGDLGAVVARALERDPAARYPSVEAFAEDLGRALRREPVRARAATLGHRLRLFAARHRLALATAATALVALLAGLTAVAWQARIAARERDAARQQAERAEGVERFLVGLFEGADPAEAKGEEITARELLERGAARIDTELAQQPATRVDLLHVLAKVHLSLGLFDPARPLLDRELATARALAVERDAAVARALNLLGNQQVYSGDNPGAIASYTEALELRRRRFGPDSLEVAETLNDLAIVHHDLRELEAAESRYREALAIQTRHLGESDPITATTASNLGGLLVDRGDLASAEALIRSALSAFRARWGNEHPIVASTIGDLARVRVRLDDFEGAEVLEREALAIQLRLLGPDHPGVSTRRNNLGRVLLRRGDFAGAEAELRQAVAIDAKSFGEESSHIAFPLENLCEALVGLGRAGEALPLCHRSSELLRRTYGPRSPRLARNLRKQALALAALGRAEAARAATDEAISLLEGPDNPDPTELATLLDLRARLPGPRTDS